MLLVTISTSAGTIALDKRDRHSAVDQIQHVLGGDVMNYHIQNLTKHYSTTDTPS
jgi:hypothetical protein